MYIDENCFLPLKMREGYPIEANFLVLVPNRGFTPVKMWGALSGASACRTEIENVTRRFKKTAFRVCESASVEREMRQYCRER